MRKLPGVLSFGALLVAGACGDDDSPRGDLFTPKPECAGEAVTPYMGRHVQAMTKLEIGAPADGFDLDGDGKPDNKLAAVASIAKSAIDDSLASFDIVIPIEFFDLDELVPDTCVKFAVYLGEVDRDGDGQKPYLQNGDCNDNDPAIRRGATEIVGNYKDDDCDGRADEGPDGTPSDDVEDHDGDGQTIADGDCDDTNPTVYLGAPEICGDGLDNDCDGVADRSATVTCSPYDPANPQDIQIDPLSFAAGGKPVISFVDGVLEARGGAMVLSAGPSVFSVNIPLTGDLALDLRITGATIEAELEEVGGKIVMRRGRLGGVIDARTADTIRGLEVEQIGLDPENSLLDATFANLLGPLLALPKAKPAILAKYDGCRTPDIDVDQDGLEAFCDSDPIEDPKTVDICVDGDGTEFADVLGAGGVVVMECTEAMKGDKPRFVDGISVGLTFETSAIKGILPPP